MGRMGRKQVKQQAKAIIESNSLVEAYKKTHNCNDNTARSHAYRMLQNPEVVAELEKQLEALTPVEVNKSNLLKMLTMVIRNWQDGKEKTADFLRAIELMSRLVPEFSDKKSLEIYGNMSSEQIDKELAERFKKFGISDQV